MSDVRHAGPDEYLIDRISSHIRKELYIIRVIWASHDWLLYIFEANFKNCCVFGIFISSEQVWIFQPSLASFYSPFKRISIIVAALNQFFHQGDIASKITCHAFFIERNRSPCCRAFCSGVC